jgi:hypothetical protein
MVVSDDVHVGHSSILTSVELKKRKNRDDIDFFTNERLLTLWYISGGFKGGFGGFSPLPVEYFSQAHILTYAFQG